MGWYGSGHDASWLGWLGMSLMMLFFWGLLVAGAFWVVRATRVGQSASPSSTRSDALQILDERLARGELTEEEYIRRRDLLHGR